MMVAVFAKDCFPPTTTKKGRALPTNFAPGGASADEKKKQVVIHRGPSLLPINHTALRTGRCASSTLPCPRPENRSALFFLQ